MNVNVEHYFKFTIYGHIKILQIKQYFCVHTFLFIHLCVGLFVSIIIICINLCIRSLKVCSILEFNTAA